MMVYWIVGLLAGYGMGWLAAYQLGKRVERWRQEDAPPPQITSDVRPSPKLYAAFVERDDAMRADIRELRDELGDARRRCQELADELANERAHHGSTRRQLRAAQGDEDTHYIRWTA